jgi:hypothetical protein
MRPSADLSAPISGVAPALVAVLSISATTCLAFALCRRLLFETEQSVSLPARAQEIAARRGDDYNAAVRRRRVSELEPFAITPAIELGGGGAGIEVPRRQVPASPRLMLAVVAQHVKQRPAYLQRRPELARVVALREHAATPSACLVDAERDANRQRAHAACQRGPIVGLRDQVDVIALYRIVRQSKPELLARSGKRAA